MMHKRHSHPFVLVSLLLICVLPTLTPAEEISFEQRVQDCLTQAMADLRVKPGSSDLCVLTNAPYVKHGKESAIVCLDAVQRSTGCTQARKNLLYYHAPVSKPLRIVLFDKGSGDGVVSTLCSGGNRVTEPCSPVAAAVSSERFEQVKLALAASKILEPDVYKDVMQKIGASDAFSIASILNSWAAGAPPDFLKACEFHNHYCPGVTGGYLMALMINEKYPLDKGEQHVWIGSPPKCGDDAMQILLDLTPGKRTCFVKGLTPEQKRAITIEERLNNVQGILVIWNNKANQGKGVVFKYNWGKVCEIAGLKFSDFMPAKGQKDPRFFTSRLKANQALIGYLDKPSELVSAAREIEVTAEMYVKMISAGHNPYEVAGLTAK